MATEGQYRAALEAMADHPLADTLDPRLLRQLARAAVDAAEAATKAATEDANHAD